MAAAMMAKMAVLAAAADLTTIVSTLAVLQLPDRALMAAPAHNFMDGQLGAVEAEHLLLEKMDIGYLAHLLIMAHLLVMVGLALIGNHLVLPEQAVAVEL